MQVSEAVAEIRASPERLPKLVKRLILSAVFSSFAVGYLVVYITAFLVQIGFNSATIGLLIGLFGIVPGIMGIPFGILSDRKGRKLLLLLGSIGVAPGVLVFAFTSNIGLLVLGTVILGLSEAAFLSTWNAMLADQTNPKNRNRAFSYSFIIGSVFFGLGSAVPFSFPFIQQAFSLSSLTMHQDFMIFASLLSLATPVIAGMSLRGYVEGFRPKGLTKPDGIMTPPSTSGKLNWIHENSRMLKFSGINSLIGLGAGFIIPLIPTWFFLKFSIGDAYTGPLLAISGITIGLSAFGSARLARKYGQIPSIALTTGASTIFMFSLAFIPNPAIAAGLYIIRAALMNMASPLLDSYLMSIIAADQRGLASSINTVIWRLPNSGSTIIGGIILQAGRYDIPFLIAGVFYASAIILFYSVFRNVKPSAPQPP